jgi:hypothetical protein
MEVVALHGVFLSHGQVWVWCFLFAHFVRACVTLCFSCSIN